MLLFTQSTLETNYVRELSEWERRELYVQEKLDQADPIWGQVAHVYSSPLHGWIALSDRSGSYLCEPKLVTWVSGWPAARKAMLTTWVTDQNRLGIPFPRINFDVITAIADGKPLRFSAKVDRFFHYLNDRGYRIGDPILPATGTETLENIAVKQNIMRWTESTDETEMYGLFAALAAAGLVTSDFSGKWLPTAEGLMRLDSLDSQGASNDQAFVAMWFSPEVNDAYENGIVPGLADAGYRAFRVDQLEHSNKIDDEIIAGIRRSRFLVADFTSGHVTVDETAVHIPRGGVYYEAGFAQGLNMPVIWTVREDQIGLVHFDTRQFNHITWKDPEDLRVKLYRRVAAVLGHFRPA